VQDISKDGKKSGPSGIGGTICPILFIIFYFPALRGISSSFLRWPGFGGPMTVGRWLLNKNDD